MSLLWSVIDWYVRIRWLSLAFARSHEAMIGRLHSVIADSLGTSDREAISVLHMNGDFERRLMTLLYLEAYLTPICS
jgi:hypothetical protein